MVPVHRRDDVEVDVVGERVQLKAHAGGIMLSVDEAKELAGRVYEAAANASGDDLDERDAKRIPMQHLKLAAEEEPPDDVEGAAPADPADTAEPRTAEIQCWIKDQTRTNALHVACGWINEDGWIVTEILEQRPVSRTDFEEAEAIGLYDQALIDDEVFLYEIDGDDDAVEPTDVE